MRKTIDYKSFEEIDISSNSLVITATKTLKKGMIKKSDNKIVDIGSILNAFYNSWEDPLMRFNHFIHLSKYINELVSSNTYSKEVINGIKRNQKEILNSIYLLTESNIFPNEIKPKNTPEKIFVDLFKKMNLLDSFINYRNIYFSKFTETNTFIDKLKTISNIDYFTKNIFLIGFYFITPMQEHFMNLLERNDFNLFFYKRINLYSNYENMIYEKNFKQYKSFKILESSNNNINRNIFNTNKKIDFQIFENTLDFIEYIENNLSNEIFVSTNKKSLDDLLKSFFSKCYENKHLLYYPVGQYLYYLYKNWDDYTQKCELKFDNVKACFASGWLIKDGINSKDLLYDLEKIQPYFDDVSDLNTWENRIKKLEKIYDNIIPLFNKNLTGEKYLKNIENPLLNFSVFDLEPKRFKLIIEFIKEIIKNSKKIFSGTSSKTLVEHFKILDDIINNKVIDEELLNEEKKIILELQKKLKYENIPTTIEKCTSEDFAKAIMLFLNGEFEEKNDLENSESINDLIISLDMIEGLCKNEDKTIHLTLADHINLPGQNTKYPWPLSPKLLDSLDIDKRKYSKKLISKTQFILNNKILENRLLFDIFLKEPYNKKISYIKVFNGTERLQSPYIDIIKDSIEYIANKPEKNHNKINEERKKYLDFKKIISREDIYDIGLDYIKREYDMCPSRYFYSFLISEYPSYDTLFHYKFSIPYLLLAINESTGDFFRRINQEVHQLFPMFNETQWQEIKRYIPKKNINNNLNFYYNNKIYRNTFTKIYWPEKENLNNKYGKCVYCFHKSICKEYLIFQKNKKENK